MGEIPALLPTTFMTLGTSVSHLKSGPKNMLMKITETQVNWMVFKIVTGFANVIFKGGCGKMKRDFWRKMCVSIPVLPVTLDKSTAHPPTHTPELVFSQ